MSNEIPQFDGLALEEVGRLAHAATCARFAQAEAPMPDVRGTPAPDYATAKAKALRAARQSGRKSTPPVATGFDARTASAADYAVARNALTRSR